MESVMKKSIFTVFGLAFGLSACGHRATTDMGQSLYRDAFNMCAHSRAVIEHFASYAALGGHCGCRAYYIAQHTTFDEYRDMVRAEFETGLTKISARVLNAAERYCESNQ
jgi:hypothetical protein